MCQSIRCILFRRRGLSLLLPIALATGILLFAACGDEDPTAVELTVDMSNIQFTPNVLEVEADKTARIELIHDGLAHTFTIPNLGVDVTIPRRKGTTVVKFFVPPEMSGDLEFFCRFHKAIDMTGTIRVK